LIYTDDAFDVQLQDCFSSAVVDDLCCLSDIVLTLSK